MRNEIPGSIMNGHVPDIHPHSHHPGHDGDHMDSHQWMVPPPDASHRHTRVGAQYQATIPALVSDSPVQEESDLV